MSSTIRAATIARRYLTRVTLAAVLCSVLLANVPRPPQLAGAHSACAAMPAEVEQDQDFQEILEIGLRARRPVEFEFIARVVQLVNNNQLPRDMVEGTFHWARRQPKRPFPYFERGLRIRARRIGVDI